MFVVYLYGYHLRLLCLNLTTHESIKSFEKLQRYPTTL